MKFPVAPFGASY